MGATFVRRWNRRGVVCTRLFLGAIFFTGGMSKLMPFPGVMGPVWLEEVLAPHGLGGFALFIAWSEAIIGLALFVPRLATLGAVMLVPLVVNILAVTISMSWRGTPYVVSGFLVMNLYLLANDLPKLKFLFAERTSEVLSTRVLWPHPLRDATSFTGSGLVLIGAPLYRASPRIAYGTIALGLVLLLLGALVARREGRA